MLRCFHCIFARMTTNNGIFGILKRFVMWQLPLIHSFKVIQLLDPLQPNLWCFNLVCWVVSEKSAREQVLQFVLWSAELTRRFFFLTAHACTLPRISAVVSLWTSHPSRLQDPKNTIIGCHSCMSMQWKYLNIYGRFGAVCLFNL